MNYANQDRKKSTFRLLVTVILVTGALVANGTTHAEYKEFTQREQRGKINASREDTVVDTTEVVKKKYTSATNLIYTSASILATHNKQAVASVKTKPKKKKIILAVVLISMIAITFINLISSSDNARFCTNCHYSGGMKAVSLSENQYLNSLLIFLVKVFPVLLYYYSERARFTCPRCHEISMNVSINRLRDTNK
jgi:hypothetical protein